MLRYYLYNGIEDTIKEYKNSFIEYYNKCIVRK